MKHLILNYPVTRPPQEKQHVKPSFLASPKGKLNTLCYHQLIKDSEESNPPRGSLFFPTFQHLGFSKDIDQMGPWRSIWRLWATALLSSSQAAGKTAHLQILPTCFSLKKPYVSLLKEFKKQQESTQTCCEVQSRATSPEELSSPSLGPASPPISACVLISLALARC